MLIAPVRLTIIEAHDTGYNWSERGEEWSAPWGNSAAQWFGTIYPRIHEYLPASAILEIGPGYGRWTHFLREQSQRLHIVDPAEQCIEACRRRFGDDPKLVYHVNDGRSLTMIPDRSIDFVFSFDSLVHVPRATVAAYLRQLPDKLSQEGVGFIHHSNLGACRSATLNALPRSVKKLLTKARVLDHEHQRAPDMTAALFRSDCQEHGLKCFRQELVNWRGRRPIDCFSTFARTESKRPGSCQILRNPDFMREAELIRRRAKTYQPESAVKNSCPAE
jgi:SAM-dependent methyltransferase